MTKIFLSPGHTPTKPLSHPEMTCPWPSVNVNGSLRSLEESNFSPLVPTGEDWSIVPVYCIDISSPDLEGASQESTD